MTTQRDVHLFVLDTLADWEVGYAIAFINRPAPGVPSPYRVRTVGFDRSPVRTLGGVTIVPDLMLTDLRSADSAMLILPGADLWFESRTDPALDKARELVRAGVPVAGICGAVFGLARAGLLDDRRHTSNDPQWLASSGYRGAAHHVNAPAVDDRGVITASATAPVDLAHLILARLGVFSPRALEAWFGLYKTGNPACYAAFMEALGHGGPA
jgi:transcriptional regulator GlxA family with amidase domain